jgi:hypothetical protein
MEDCAEIEKENSAVSSSLTQMEESRGTIRAGEADAIRGLIIELSLC